jgi:hypothetical protein
MLFIIWLGVLGSLICVLVLHYNQECLDSKIKEVQLELRIRNRQSELKIKKLELKKGLINTKIKEKKGPKSLATTRKHASHRTSNICQ